MIDILENRAAWDAGFAANWLKYYQETGNKNFDLYNWVSNTSAPSGDAIDLSQSKLLFVTSSGAYIKDAQQPYDAASLYGDYSIRTLPSATPLRDIHFAHEHFDHKWVDQDAGVMLPLRLLETMQSEGIIGEVAETVISFHGYAPDVGRLLDDTLPQIMGIAKAQQVDAVLLAPG